MKSPKFKIGDRVRNVYSNWNSTLCNESNNHAEIGIEGTIEKVGCSMGGVWYDFAYKVKWDNGKFCGKGEPSLELVQEAKMTKVEKKVYTFKVSRQALAEVFPLVCSGYRDKINKLAQKDLFSNEIEVSEDIVRQAYKSATETEQKEWLEKYLPLPKKKKIEILGMLDSNLELVSGVDPILKYRTNYKLIAPKGISGYEYDIFTAEPSIGYIRVYYGYWNDGVTED